MKRTADVELALDLHEEINCLGVTENANVPNGKGGKRYKPRTLIDRTLELIDPTPSIYTLFVQFNERFFWNTLLPVEVKWSNRMTSCAGICSFNSRSRHCVISLSAPLLKLRPRKDLVETLLHEMIHGYLFLTNNNRDRDGHGPEFCSHMKRINMEAGTNITIYHSFHDEVRLYQQHWWRCNGPCQQRAPYFGTVRRAMNRAPGPTDFWWKEHQLSCGGQFVKVKEPENFKARNSKTKETEKRKPAPKADHAGGQLLGWLKNSTPSSVKVRPTLTPVSPKPIQKPLQTAQPSLAAGFKKLGNSTNNVHGWGTSGPTGATSSVGTSRSNNVPNSQPSRSTGSSILGGSKTGRSNLLTKFETSRISKKSSDESASRNRSIDSWVSGSGVKPRDTDSPAKAQPALVKCPVCRNSVPSGDINRHVDKCLLVEDETVKSVKPVHTNTPVRSKPSKRRNRDANIFLGKQPRLESVTLGIKLHGRCPVCDGELPIADMDEHLDGCLSRTGALDAPIILNDSICDMKDDSVIFLDTSSESVDVPSSPRERSPTAASASRADRTGRQCLVCNAAITAGASLNDHLEECIGDVFNADDTKTLLESELEDKSEQPGSPNVETVPCPVCMELVAIPVMNDHLDTCLK